MVRGVVSCYEPCRRLAYSWLDASSDISVSGKPAALAEAGRVNFNLDGGQGRTLLSLTHSGLSAPVRSRIRAGWRAHLALLANVLSEEADGSNTGGYREPFTHRGTYTGSLPADVNI